MKRWLSKFLARVSLMLCVVVCALWARSYWRSDALWFTDAAGNEEPRRVRTWLVYSGAGRVQVGMGSDLLYGPRVWRVPHWFQYLTEKGPANPENTAVTGGWVKKFGGFGVIDDWEAAPPPEAVKRWLAVSGDLVIKESFRAVFVPHWVLVLVFGMMPARRIYVGVRRRRRRARGLCLKCGYDMRGSGERCPECGEVFLGDTGEAPVPR